MSIQIANVDSILELIQPKPSTHKNANRFPFRATLLSKYFPAELKNGDGGYKGKLKLFFSEEPKVGMGFAFHLREEGLYLIRTNEPITHLIRVIRPTDQLSSVIHQFGNSSVLSLDLL